MPYAPAEKQGDEMPWFPDFASAVELAREQTRAAGRADPVGEYFTALNHGDTHALETVWPGEVVIYDPRAGEVRGHKQVRRFIGRNLSWLAGLHARAQTVASTVASGRAAHPGDVVGRYLAALAGGDVEAMLNTFAPDGYFHGPFGARDAHRGPPRCASSTPGASARVAASASSTAP